MTAEGPATDVMSNLDRTRAKMTQRRAEEAAAKPPSEPVESHAAPEAAGDTPAGRKGRSEDAKRWDTLNGFDDEIARLLTLAEQAAWHYLFRHCRGGKVEASTRGIAASIGVDPKTVTAALATLKKARLLWEIAKSTHRGEMSLYGMHPHPARCREACEAIARERQSSRGGRRRPK